MTGEKLWSEIENFMLDYYYDTGNYCETYIDVKYSRKALYDFLNKKIEEIRNEEGGTDSTARHVAEYICDALAEDE